VKVRRPKPGKVATLDQLRTVPDLCYRLHTVVEAQGGVDGDLENEDSSLYLPLDLYTPSEMEHFSSDIYGIALSAEAMSETVVREAVLGWCRDNLGRDDIKFEF